MQILMTGGTGFIGKNLTKRLLEKGHRLCILTRNLGKAHQRLLDNQIRYITNLEQIGKDESFDAVINLAGAPIVQRWTKRYKETLVQSRVDLTRQLISLFKTLKQPPAVLISGSAIGYYGPQTDNELTEESKPQDSFSHELCQAWENAANQATALGIRVCCLRTGIVLGRSGGALQKMRLPFFLGLGGPIGEGKQWMSWIHMHDMVELILFCLENKDIHGPVNATAPMPVTNQEFAQTYAQVLHRPCFLVTPPWALKILFGQMANELLITGQKVVPLKLQNQHFVFQYPQLKQALEAVEKPDK